MPMRTSLLFRVVVIPYCVTSIVSGSGTLTAQNASEQPTAGTAILIRNAEAGDQEAQNHLGGCICTWLRSPSKLCRCSKVVAPSCRAGHTSAQKKLGDAYAHGIGVRLDYAQGIRWLRAAADQGYLQRSTIWPTYMSMCPAQCRTIARQHGGIKELLNRDSPRRKTISPCCT